MIATEVEFIAVDEPAYVPNADICIELVPGLYDMFTFVLVISPSE